VANAPVFCRNRGAIATDSEALCAARRAAYVMAWVKIKTAHSASRAVAPPDPPDPHHPDF